MSCMLHAGCMTQALAIGGVHLAATIPKLLGCIQSGERKNWQTQTFIVAAAIST